MFDLSIHVARLRDNDMHENNELQVATLFNQ